MGYIDLGTYYNTLFMMRQHHQYTLEDIYHMFPYERDIFVVLIKNHLDALEIEREKAKNKGG